jgi:hypothetical protein
MRGSTGCHFGCAQQVPKTHADGAGAFQALPPAAGHFRLQSTTWSLLMASSRCSKGKLAALAVLAALAPFAAAVRTAGGEPLARLVTLLMGENNGVRSGWLAVVSLEWQAVISLEWQAVVEGLLPSDAAGTACFFPRRVSACTCGSGSVLASGSFVSALTLPR